MRLSHFLRAPAVLLPSSRFVAPRETLLICNELLGCSTPDAVAQHFRRRGQRYDVVNHLTAANRVALLDPKRLAEEAALPHLLCAERYIAPVISHLAPREIMAYVYVSALYARPMTARHLSQLEASLLRQLDTAAAVGVSPVWAGPRQGNEERLTTVPQACFAVLSGPGGGNPPQDVPNALWAATRARLTAPPILASIFSELVPVLRSAPPLPIESLLRTAWACARMGCDDPAVVDALIDALAARDATKRPLSFSQRVLVAWALVTLGREAHPYAIGIIGSVLNLGVLGVTRGTLALSSQQQIVQMYTLLVARQRSGALAVNVPSALPEWLWQLSERQAAPSEVALGSDDAVSLGVSATLKGLGIPHRRRFLVDGYSVDIAFPAKRRGVEIVNTRAATLLPAPLPARNGNDTEPQKPSPEPTIMATTLHRTNQSKRAYLAAKGWSLVELDWSVWRALDAAGRDKLARQLADA